MERGELLAVCLLCWSCTVSVVTAIQTADLFLYGSLNGDLVLAEGDDETSKVLSLPRPLYFYDSPFSQLYVATNGIISAQDLPMEKQYVDDGFPTDFPVVAPFLADIDTSGGRGQIYYRVTETPSVLNRVAQEVQRGFPDAKFTPTHAVVATWESVAAYEEQARTAGPSNKVNTFQAVIGYDESDSYTLFLYPEGGLKFFGTRPKESYNVEIELPARVGFSRGEVTYLIFSRTEGPHYSVTTNEQSVKNLYQVGNTGIPGVWLFHTGNRYSFNNVVPASVGGLLATPPPDGHGFSLDTTTPEYAEFEEYPDNTLEPDIQEEEHDYPLTGGDPEFHPAPSPSDHSEAHQPANPSPPAPSEVSDPQGPLNNEEVPLTSEPIHNSEPAATNLPAPRPPESPPQGGAEEQQPQTPPEVLDVYPPQRHQPPLSRGGHVVSVDEDDVDFDTGVIHYTTENRETCARFQQQCSQNAFCSDYPSGYCCHCQSGFYGNGRHCLPEGAPQRVSGKVSGTVNVGSTPVVLNNIDLHAYIVVGDGRAYTAISEVPELAGLALMPVAPIGELFGWLFALELPNSQAGFKITGAKFARHAEVVFYPGNQRLSVIQTGRGLDDHNHLTVDTVLSGSVPVLPPGAEISMDPFKEIYQYYPSLATSSSVREFTVDSADRGLESFSFQLKQNISFQDCRHDNRAPALETLQVIMERVFVMYVKEERILRYAITNKISPVGVESTRPELINPCYAGNHDCDTTAQCIPLEGQDFQCQCATGYRGDGHNCYDIDECAESLTSCGAHSQCVNLPGSHRCQCQSGFEFGFDGRTCVDIDECGSSPCHINARCLNGLGSFDCQCQPGFYGDGLLCSQPTDHPKSQCEQHRDSLQSGLKHGGAPNLGAFIPQCDTDGSYRPQQCHGSTGHCWCVDNRGQERPGTRTPPGTAPTDCYTEVLPEHPKTLCEHHRDSVQTTSPEGLPIVGAYVPQCDVNGQYIRLQCHGSTGHCWCVDSNGQEQAGTRTPPGTTPTNCDNPDEPERPKTRCQHHRDSVQTTSPEGYPILGVYVPQCDDNGLYRPLQCHGSSGYCWCVDSRGQEREGTRAAPGTPTVDCDKADDLVQPKTHCQHHRDSVQTTSPEGYPILGAYVPQCDTNGQYIPLQCHGSTGHCWCVDSNGQERAGTRTAPGAPPTDCDRPDEPERPKTHCQHHRDSVQTTSPEGYPILGAYRPQCDDNGQYVPQQCHGSTGHCWCVDSNGRERAGTRTSAGEQRKDCDSPDEPERPKTQCQQHRDSVQTEGFSVPGVFVPQCDANGQYTSKQCHSSTGHCWCVDSNGQERAGTRTPPGAPAVDCDRPDEPERPKTHCQHHRDSVQTTSPEGYPILGAYRPQCDDNGQYVPQQCHGSTGHCWCVDSNGRERAGTRTSAGEQRKDCDSPDEPERPKTHCQHHRDSVQTTSPEGYPILGVYLPQCDDNGQYVPLQCHGSTGHCWCVDSNGRERAGTRTSAGEQRKDCDSPDEPERPKTHCQHHRDSVQTTSPEGYPILGAYVPQCDDNGQYTSKQCHGSTGHCWCVDSNGQERAGTRTPPGAPTVDCDRPDEPERPKTLCEDHRERTQTRGSDTYPVLGSYVPQCDANGQYLPQQCHSSTGRCWCVDSNGQERAGTRTPPGAPTVDCDRPERPKTHCQHHRDSVQSTSPEGYPILGAYRPQCDDNGEYTPEQCHGSTGHCWCVDSNGRERAGTRTSAGEQRKDCDSPDEPERPKTHCQHHRDSVQTTSPEGYPILGAYRPQCDDNGQYVPQQCHGSTGHCWCVDSNGRERAGTRTSAGEQRKDCDSPDEPERPKTQCQQHRDSVQTEGFSVPGVFVPQCDANGQYTSKQCHSSTGHCWCVDSNGQERAGTRTPPGAPAVDCDRPDEPERPKTHCQHHRDSVQTTSPEGYPILGAYRPQCDDNGQYVPQQCHGSTGHCWCVDSNGRERAGTRTSAGEQRKDCDSPDEPERPKTQCQQHRDSVQTEGFSVPGVFVPQCDANGQYTSKQCHSSTGHCWCVDSNGQERAGTRTPPGAPAVDCDRPVPVPPTQRPESVCERWRTSLIEHYGGKPEPQQYLPQCEPDGQFSPVQCYGETTYCWCVDQDGREIAGTRSYDVVKPACLPSVAPPTVRPLPRPDVTPPPHAEVTLLYAQGQKIGALPLNGTRLDETRARTLLTLHGSIVVGLAYDCKENHVYWTDLSARTINRAAMAPGAEPEILINTNLVSPEGLAVDAHRGAMFWVDSNTDVIETSNLDGSGRRTLFDTDLVNPRAIIVVSSTGTLYWTDWNREAPKIESSTVDGQNRRVVVSDGIGLPNALTYDASSGQVCWADAGTKRLECVFPDGTGRRVIHPTLNYPFNMVYYRNHFYYTDWRRDGVIVVNKESSQITDEFLPDQRSHLYGIAIATRRCLSGNQ
ncbi:nidogen-2 isoform X7 [Takifugu rubripes]|uniref:nidogen-2 isoform X6 n=1 Tax=Takifugu rubripes TaxID=31033 RepID=UPI0011460F23|nr:nidogen-2 isoform X6 [Takifugu rubripes]XP_029695958.1 nidogen-2 isoform X7 [Takifugu rubripes]